jgi:excisionase family DNA binding protein
MTVELLDSQQAAARLLIHPKTLQRMAREGKVPAFQIGTLWRYDSSKLDEWVRDKLSSSPATRAVN